MCGASSRLDTLPSSTSSGAPNPGRCPSTPSSASTTPTETATGKLSIAGILAWSTVFGGATSLSGSRSSQESVRMSLACAAKSGVRGATRLVDRQRRLWPATTPDGALAKPVQSERQKLHTMTRIHIESPPDYTSYPYRKAQTAGELHHRAQSPCSRSRPLCRESVQPMLTIHFTQTSPSSSSATQPVCGGYSPAGHVRLHLLGARHCAPAGRKPAQASYWCRRANRTLPATAVGAMFKKYAR